MLTKQEHIEYWKKTAASDWKVVQQLFEVKSYVQSLFFAHLVLEKLLKANWVKDNTGNYPPRIHNLVILASKTSLQFNEDEVVFLGRMNDLQLEGRYPDYIKSIHKRYKLKEATQILKQTDQIRKCLLKSLQ